MSDITVSMDDFHGATIKLLAMSAAIQRVRELHKPFESINGELLCDVCYVIGNYLAMDASPASYPCSTIKALDGEQ